MHTSSIRAAALAVVALVLTAPVRAQTNVSPDSTNSSSQTIGTAGSTSLSPFYASFNFGTSFASTTATGSSGSQIRYTLGATGGLPVNGSTNPSSGYTLASGTTASGNQNRGLAAAYPATVSGSTSPGLNFLMQAPPLGADYLYQVQAVQFGSRSAATGPTRIVLRSSENDYKVDLASAAVSADGTWRAVNFSPADTPTFQRTFSLFGLAGSGSASPNWQVDDLYVSGSLYTTTGATRGAGTYGISGVGTGTFSGAFSITGTATFNLISGGTVNVTGPVSGYLARIDKQGAGTLKLSGSNTYIGDTVVYQGSLVAGSSNAFGVGTLAINNGATLDLGNFSIGNPIVTRGGATILNSGNYAGAQLVDTGTTTYAQPVSGTMAVADGAKANFDSSFLGTANLNGAADFNSSMSGLVSIVGSGSATFDGLVSGSVGLSGSAAKAIFSSLITGTVAPSDGALSVITGTVDPSAAVQVGGGGKVQFGNGLDFQQPTLPNAGLVEMTNSGSLALGTSITGTGGFTMAGSGLTSLSGSSSFTGGTDITTGTLAASNPNALGQGGVDVSSGATFVLDTDLILGGTNGVKLDPGALLQSKDGASAPIAGNSALGGVTTSGSGSPSSPATAALLAGTASGSGGTLATTWSSLGKPASAVSDILELTTPTGSSAFVLSMNYDPASETSELWLGWKNGTEWINAVAGNTGNNASLAQQGYLGAFTAFQTTYGDTLTNYIGAYGRDNATDTVWAVVNHNSEFVAFLAPVPEPATIVLAGTAAVVIGVRCRRKRRRRTSG